MHPVTEGGAIHTEGEKEAEQTCPATCTSLQVNLNHEENSSKKTLQFLGVHFWLMTSEKPLDFFQWGKKRRRNLEHPIIRHH